MPDEHELFKVSLIAIPLGHRDAEMLEHAFEVERKQITLRSLEQRQRHREDHRDSLVQEQVQYAEDHVERKLGGEESQKPLTRVHVRLNIEVDKVFVQRAELGSDQAFQLIKTHVQALEVGLVDLAYLVAIHYFDEQIERLLFGHVQEKRGDQKGEALAVAHLFVVDRVGLGELVEGLLAALVLKELMTRESAVYVADDHLLARGLFGE